MTHTGSYCCIIYVTVLFILRRISHGSNISESVEARNALGGNGSVEWVRNPTDCSIYYLCVNGVASPMPKCAWTHVWSNSVKNCVPVNSRWDDCVGISNTTVPKTGPDNVTPTAFIPLKNVDPSPTSAEDYYVYYYDASPAEGSDEGDYSYYDESENENEADISLWPEAGDVSRDVSRDLEDNDDGGFDSWVQNEEPSQNDVYPTGTNWYEDYTTQAAPGTAWSYVPECGVSASNMIVGGLPSSEGSWPWAVSLRLTWADRHVCGGTLIHPRWIVTAAHCVHGGQFNIPGEWRAVFAEYIDGDSYKTVRNIDLISKHPDFINGGNYPNDIALMRLAEPIDVAGINIRHACLPSRYSDFGPQDTCWIMGWGETKEYANQAILQELQVNVRSLTECAARWGRKRILNSQICVGDGDNGACNGDSGGPLVCYRAGYFFVVGVTSWGVSGCQTSGYPSVFTRVSFYENWIDEHISSLR